MKRRNNACVLCADDDRDTCELVQALMAVFGVRVVSTNTSSGTLQLAQSESFDLYLLDGEFPDGDGPELCRRIREFDDQTPIVFFSGYASDVERRKAIEAGANDYIVKPDFERRLPTTLLRLIGSV